MQTAERVELPWTELVAGLAGGALTATATVLRSRWDGVERARIEADASTEIATGQVLLARVRALEERDAEQDERIERLIRENSALQADRKLLADQNALLRRQVEALEDERDVLYEERDTLREDLVELRRMVGLVDETEPLEGE